MPPNTDLEEMLLRMFAPREAVSSQPDDPARLAAIAEEWRVFYALEWWRTEPAAAAIRSRIAARLNTKARQWQRAREEACPTST